METVSATAHLVRSNASRLNPRRIADAAVWALREEALLTPKPGLVDRRSCGAHRDMDLPMLLRAATALHPAFERIAACATTIPFGFALRERLGAIGRDAEACMLAATGGVNTHRGAIWALGLIAAAMAGADAAKLNAKDMCVRAGRIARLPVAASMQASHGHAMLLRHGARGARGEAEDGFPHVHSLALPALRTARLRCGDEGSARLHTLLTLMANLDDTCVLFRGGRAALDAAKKGASCILAAGVDTLRGRIALADLDRRMLQMNASPGGSADLLAATLFLDRATAMSGVDHGDA